jgi:hypothetical protein
MNTEASEKKSLEWRQNTNAPNFNWKSKTNSRKNCKPWSDQEACHSDTDGRSQPTTSEDPHLKEEEKEYKENMDYSEDESEDTYTLVSKKKKVHPEEFYSSSQKSFGEFYSSSQKSFGDYSSAQKSPSFGDYSLVQKKLYDEPVQRPKSDYVSPPFLLRSDYNSPPPQALVPLAKDDKVKIEKAGNIQWNTVKPMRAGVIVYSKKGKELSFSLGVHSSTGEITDFGGGISYKKDRNALTGALREFREESHSAFGNKFDIGNSWVVYDADMLIAFVEIAYDPNETLKNFNSSKTIRSEICELVWASKSELTTLIEGGTLSALQGLRQRKMYTKCRELLIQGMDIFKLL